MVKINWKYQVLAEMKSNQNSHTLLVGMRNGADTLGKKKTGGFLESTITV
jgi:hypothetical protein